MWPDGEDRAGEAQNIGQPVGQSVGRRSSNDGRAQSQRANAVKGRGNRPSRIVDGPPADSADEAKHRRQRPFQRGPAPGPVQAGEEDSHPRQEPYDADHAEGGADRVTRHQGAQRHHQSEGHRRKYSGDARARPVAAEVTPCFWNCRQA